MIIIKNNPILSEAFQKEEVKMFFKNLLEELYDAYTLKEFLTDGFEKTYQNQIKQLSKSFIPIVYDINDVKIFLQVMRCIDKEMFMINRVVLDKVSNQNFIIGKMYEDNRGLHIQLKVDESITWRDLSQIENI